ncbi:hypothetical protein CFRS1_v009759 [Colletotrichum fructicola]|nr:hypothetical protein CFRS1_v009759 [Colletotrichum fructicola]
MSIRTSNITTSQVNRLPPAASISVSLLHLSRHIRSAPVFRQSLLRRSDVCAVSSARRAGPEASVPSRRYNVFRPAAQSRRGKSPAAVSHTLDIRFALPDLPTFPSGRLSHLEEVREVFTGIRIVIGSLDHPHIDLEAVLLVGVEKVAVLGALDFVRFGLADQVVQGSLAQPARRHDEGERHRVAVEFLCHGHENPFGHAKSHTVEFAPSSVGSSHRQAPAALRTTPSRRRERRSRERQRRERRSRQYVLPLRRLPACPLLYSRG